MNLRQRVILIVSALVAVLALIIGAVSMSTKKSKEPTKNETPTVIDQNNIDTAIKVGVEPTQIPQTAEVKPPTPTQQEDITVKNLAKIFVERYHTYSSENNYENIRDVREMVTDVFWSKISAPLSSPQPLPNSFVSLTTKVVSILFVDVKKSGDATVELKVRKTSVTNGITSYDYGEYVVNLTKLSNKWLVSGEVAK